MNKLYSIKDNKITINGITKNRSTVEAMAANWSLREMADYFKVSLVTIKNMLKEAGIDKAYKRNTDLIAG